MIRAYPKGYAFNFNRHVMMQNLDEVISGLDELKDVDPALNLEIRNIFIPIARDASRYVGSYFGILNTFNENRTPEVAKEARTLRLELRQIRIKSDKARKEQKSSYLAASKAIDKAGKVIKDSLDQMEAKLSEIEEYEERERQERIQKLHEERAKAIEPYDSQAWYMDLGSMPEQVWQAYFNTTKKKYEDDMKAAEEAAKKEAEEKAKKEAELEAIRKENENLRKEVVELKTPIQGEIETVGYVSPMDERDQCLAMLISLKNTLGQYVFQQRKYRDVQNILRDTIGEFSDKI